MERLSSMFIEWRPLVELATDNFDRAANNDLGTQWTPHPAETRFGIASAHPNAVTPASLSSDCMEYYSGLTWPNNQYAQANISVVGTGGGARGIGLALRVDPVNRRYYRVNCDHAASGNIDCGMILDAVTYVNIWRRTLAFTDGALLRLEIQGGLIRAFMDGVQIGADAYDYTIASGYAGISYSSASTDAWLDNWSGGGAARLEFKNRIQRGSDQRRKFPAVLMDA